MFTAHVGGVPFDPHPNLAQFGAVCPTCGRPVTPRCGQIVTWHWAHKSGVDCDTWAEPDSEWHRAWQLTVPSGRREVTMGPHRADIVTPDGIVVELQHSTISPAVIAEREAFYNRLIWLFDATNAYQDGRFNLRQRSYGVSFRWKHPRRSVAACRRTVLVDFGADQLLRIRKIHPEAPCGGWGELITVDDFVATINGQAR